MADTIAREKAVAEDQKRQYQVEGLSAHADLKRRTPTLYNNIVGAKGITSDMADAKGRYIPAAMRGSNAGTVNMKAPDGTIRAVPADQVEAAKAAGGVPL